MIMEEDRILAGFHQEVRNQGTKLGMTDISRGKLSRKET
jgi:hypothetical protein